MGQSQPCNKGVGVALAPSEWIRRFAPQVVANGTVLDVACGGGRHGRLFLESHRVCFLDRDLGGVEDLRGTAAAELLQADIEAGPWPLKGRAFDAVVVTNYLWRPLFPELLASLKPSALLIYETFMIGNERFGKPSNPDFLLKPNELFDLCRETCDILAFEQGKNTNSVRQRICAQKRMA
jgi:SAM-dependent methyltransferase